MSQRFVLRKAGNDKTSHNDDTIIQAEAGTAGEPDVLTFSNEPKNGSMHILSIFSTLQKGCGTVSMIKCLLAK